MTCSSTVLKYPLAVLAKTPAAYILMYCNAYLLYQLKPIPEISVKNISKIFYYTRLKENTVRDRRWQMFVDPYVFQNKVMFLIEIMLIYYEPLFRCQPPLSAQLMEVGRFNCITMKNENHTSLKGRKYHFQFSRICWLVCGTQKIS